MINIYCHLIESLNDVVINVAFMEKNSKNIYTTLFNVSDDYCKSQNSGNNNIMTMIERGFNHLMPGVLQQCPINVRISSIQNY